jgi:hypothetical protein
MAPMACRSFLYFNTLQITNYEKDVANLPASTQLLLDRCWDYLDDNSVIYFDEIMNYPGHKDHELLALFETLSDHSASYEIIMKAADFREALLPML